MTPTASPSRYRWVVLAVGSLATAALAAVQGGLPALAPAIQETFDLSLVEVTAVFTAFALGTVLTLLAWGVLSDRAGERVVIGGGLAAGALAMFAAAGSHGYTALLVWMVLAGMLGSSALAASGRAVFGWFPRDERGLALGLRQTAVPVGAALASFTLPPLASAAGVHAALYALAGADARVGACLGDLAARRAAHRIRRAAGTRRRARPAHLAAERRLVADDHRAGGRDLAAGALPVQRARLDRRARGAGARRRAGRAPRSRGCPPAAGPTFVASGSSRFGASPRWPACCCSRPSCSARQR